MCTLHRVSYIDRRGFLAHEWFPTMFTANDRANELVTLGMENVDFEEVEVPWNEIGDLIHWLNHNVNSPAVNEPQTQADLAMANMRPRFPLDPDAAPEHTVAEVSPAPTSTSDASASALESQVGGDHYKKLGDYQPWAVLQRWLTPEEFRGYMKGQAIAYLARERDKGGDEDVAKAEHYLRGLLELKGGV